MGYLKGELAGQRAVMDLAMPDTFSVGFDWVSGRPVIQGDELLYPSSREEPAAYFGFASDLTASSELAVSDYPLNPIANDRRIEVPVCALFGLDIGPIGLASSPDGLVAYKCDDGWHVMSEKSYRVSVDITALGRDQLAWTEGDKLVRFASDDSYETIPVVGLPDGPTIAVRAHGDGFRLVVAKAHAELWEVSADGMAKQVGIFPDSPYVANIEESVLTGLGDLIEVNPDQVMRRTLAGDVDVVYNEDDGFVDVGGAWLVISP